MQTWGAWAVSSIDQSQVTGRPWVTTITNGSLLSIDIGGKFYQKLIIIKKIYRIVGS